jgi:predicted DsbA family dithiol-disulfide isomerase|tara:strand:+ start:2513 stop:2626 length:114 start_codon:yes stop_codon:yes gene_type:complete
VKYGIMKVPTIVINGEAMFVGVPKKEILVKAIREVIK